MTARGSAAGVASAVVPAPEPGATPGAAVPAPEPGATPGAAVPAPEPGATPGAAVPASLPTAAPGAAVPAPVAAPRPTETPPADAAGLPANDPPRVVHARVEAPEAVVAEQEFELIVGLAAGADPHVVAKPMTRPASSVGPYIVTIQVIAEGFSLREGEIWRVDLPVTVDQPYPSRALHLASVRASAPIQAASIRAMFSVDGHPIGLAVRPVAIVRDAALLAETVIPPSAPAVEMDIPRGQLPPDLTIRIERAESQASGRLLVQLLAADPAVALPSEPLLIDIGAEPADDLRRIVDEMNAVEGTPTQYVSLRGIGLAIADQLPEAFWEALRAVAARVHGRPPMLLFLSAEPYVPWELAVVDPPLDPSAPPFLSAQANVGRWVLGQRRPKLPPPASLPVSALAVVSGVYDRPGWQRLVEAEAEATDLVDEFGAQAIDATVDSVLEVLRGTPSAEIIHFAVHGVVESPGGREGLLLVDGAILDPLAIRERVPGGPRQPAARRPGRHGGSLPRRGRRRGGRAALVDR
jgi:hypothetical protein